MLIHSSIPLDITIISFTPGLPGRFSGPPERCYPPEPLEIEFEVQTRTGHLLSESDLGELAWGELCDNILTNLAEKRQAALDDAIVDAWETRRDMDRTG